MLDRVKSVDSHSQESLGLTRGFVTLFFRFLTLKGGLKHLKHEESRRAADPLVFVKENVGTFLDAVDTLKSIFCCLQ